MSFSGVAKSLSTLGRSSHLLERALDPRHHFRRGKRQRSTDIEDGSQGRALLAPFQCPDVVAVIAADVGQFLLAHLPTDTHESKNIAEGLFWAVNIPRLDEFLRRHTSIVFSCTLKWPPTIVVILFALRPEIVLEECFSNVDSGLNANRPGPEILLRVWNGHSPTGGDMPGLWLQTVLPFRS